MKFEFYYKGKKKKTQVIKAKTYDEFKMVATIAKCEITRENILKDLDLSEHILLCKVNDNVLSMKDLWKYITQKVDKINNKSDEKKTKKKKVKDSSDKKDESKKKKKDKKKKKKSQEIKNGRIEKPSSKSLSNENDKIENGLIKISRRDS